MNFREILGRLSRQKERGWGLGAGARLRSFASSANSILSTALLVAALTFSSQCFAIDPMEFTDRAEEVRFQGLLRELRCLQCQNQTLADSDADIARQLRNEVFRMIREGQTDDQIKDFMTARYGDFVLYNPPVKSGTWLLWFGPFVILGGGALALAVHLRKRRANAAPVSNTAREEEDW